jgi:hypothetical protein
MAEAMPLLLDRCRARLSVCSFLVLAVGCATQGNGQGRDPAATGSQVRERREAGVREAEQEPVSMRAERGSIDRDDAEDAINRHFNRLKRCYEAAGPAMGYAAGPVKLHFDVETDGSTLGVRVIESGLGNFSVESCLTGTARNIRFPRPHGGARATFEYSMEFRSSQERAVIDLPGEAAGLVRPAILARLAVDCGALNTGTLDATVYVDRRGQVLSAGFAAPAAIPAEHTACALTSLQRAPLPLHGLALGDGVSRLTVTVTGESLAAAATAQATTSRKDRLVSGRRHRRRR